jgi:His-Xaa-Ser system protein HxsD
MTGEPGWSVEDKTLTVDVDETIYTRATVLRAAYWFTDRCFLFITRPASGRLAVHIKAKPPTLEQPAPENLEAVAGEFTNALLEYQLRQDIEAQTGKIRELLVAKAFAESGILEDEPPGATEDPVEEQRLVRIRARSLNE